MQKNIYYEMNEDELNDNRRFKARREIIIGLIRIIFKRKKDITILDVGSGTGYLLERLLQKGYTNVGGLDCSEDSIGICEKKGIHIEYGSLPSISVDKKYDCITCLDVIEHIDDDKTSIRNIIMKLKHDGKAMFTVPAYRFLRGHHDETAHHKRRYTVKEFKNVIENAGGRVDYVSYYNFFLFPIALLLKYINKKSNNINPRIHGFVNKMFYRIFRSEFWFIKRGFKFPFGISIIAVVSKG